MTSKNDITGDRLINKTLSKEGEENWDRIFKKEDINLNINIIIKLIICPYRR